MNSEDVLQELKKEEILRRLQVALDLFIEKDSYLTEVLGKDWQ